MSDTTQNKIEAQTIVFKLGDECYGVDIFRVNEIIRMRDITPIPRTEPHIRGLVNLRGKTIPVVDLKLRLGMDAFSESDSTRIIVLDSEDGTVGILVDEVREVVSLDPEKVDSAPALVTDLDTDFVGGVAKSDHGLITLLNLDRALAA
jgi:purine-binding chemotaxis protein CheW